MKISLPFVFLLVVGFCVFGCPKPAWADESRLTKTLPAGWLNDFACMRSEAKKLVADWNAWAQLFRADLWGAYSKSRFQPTGARLLFFVPEEKQTGFEVRIENNTFRGLRYPLELTAAPRASRNLSPCRTIKRRLRTPFGAS
jgi:hypothetical protein